MSPHHSYNSKVYTIAQKMPTICLCMIVKNEAHIIKRCLDSARPICNYISVCDTGSTDDTAAIITQYGQEHSVPTVIHHHTWVNFGHNRTLSITSAKDSYPEADYLLFLDADMTLKIDPAFNRNKLTHGCYMIVQRNGCDEYSNTRLVRAKLPWTCKCATHEYYHCSTEYTTGNLHTLKIDDLNDGGSRSDKFERDARLLEAALKDKPGDPRSLFYLAQTYKALKRYEEAKITYEKRILAKDFEEEVWFSYYQIGNIFNEMLEERKHTPPTDKVQTTPVHVPPHDAYLESAVYYWLKAYNYRPWRAEPLYMLSKLLRDNNMPGAAYDFAILGYDMPVPNDLLFISTPVYKYQMVEEVSITACYTKPKRVQQGLEAIERLLTLDIPENVRQQAYKNVLFYISKLPGTPIPTLPAANRLIYAVDAKDTHQLLCRGQRYARIASPIVMMGVKQKYPVVVCSEDYGTPDLRSENIYRIYYFTPDNTDSDSGPTTNGHKNRRKTQSSAIKYRVHKSTPFRFDRPVIFSSMVCKDTGTTLYYTHHDSTTGKDCHYSSVIANL